MQKYTSANTSINSKQAPALYKMPKAVAIMRNKRVIDIGGGKYDTPIKAGLTYGAKVSIYDPYNRSNEHNKKVMNEQYDVAVTSNVLNVIDSAEARAKVVLQCAEKADTILVTVYEGDGKGEGRVSKADCWQENRKTPSYLGKIAEVLPGWNIAQFGKLIVCERVV